MRELNPNAAAALEDERENPTPLAHQPTSGPRVDSVKGTSPPLDETWCALAVEREEEDVYLCELTGVDDLRKAMSLQVVINTCSNSISHLGRKLVTLQELNLNGSVIKSLRDLGTGFKLLQVLWVSRCGLTGFEGAAALPCLRELYASYNDISDLQELDGSLPELEVLDLEGNCIRDLQAVQHLASCALTSLVLNGNPAAEAVNSDAYRMLVLATLPALLTLDNEDVVDRERQAAHRRATSSRRHSGSGREPHGGCADGGDSHGGPAAGELALVRDAIKHARVGVDSMEFRELEMGSLLQGSCPHSHDGDCSASPRPTSSAVMPFTSSAWMRTLRSSQSGTLAALRQSRQASPFGPGGTSGTAGGRGSSSSGDGSPGWSRPPSAPEGTTGRDGGVSEHLTVLQRQGSSGAQRTPLSTSARAGPSARPFTSRPGSSGTTGRIGTASAGATTALPTSNLYWRKNRINSSVTANGGGASGGCSSSGWLGGSVATHGSIVAGVAGTARGSDQEEREEDCSSILTHGADSRSAFGGSLVRDLKKWKHQTAPALAGASGRPWTADDALHGSTDTDGQAVFTASRLRLHPHHGQPVHIVEGALGRDAFLEELRMWKLDAADKALQLEDATTARAADTAWPAAAAEDVTGAAPGTAQAGRGRAADILDLGSAADAPERLRDAYTCSSSVALYSNGVWEGHHLPGGGRAPSPLQQAQLVASGSTSLHSVLWPSSQALPPPAVRGGRKSMLAKVVHDMKQGMTHESGPSVPLRAITAPKGAGHSSGSLHSAGPGGVPLSCPLHHAAHVLHSSSGGTLSDMLHSVPARSSGTAAGDESLSLHSRPSSRDEPLTSSGGCMLNRAVDEGRDLWRSHCHVLSVAGEIDMGSNNPRPRPHNGLQHSDSGDEG